MIEVEVRDFQSIEHATIRVDGFTALVGKSNIGKSALVRAVKAALTGASGTSFVRHGTACARRLRNAKTCDCYCSVHIRTEGFDLKWEKGDKRNQYEFNGKNYSVPNRGTPDFLERPSLQQDFGMVKVGEQWRLLQIADQFDNTFLLDQTGATVADVFSDVARLDHINVAMRLVERDRKESVSTRKVREGDVGNYARQLVAYTGLDETVAEVDRIEKGLDRISSAQEKFESINSYIDDIKILGFKVESLQQACAVQVPDIAPVVSKQNSFDRVTKYSVSISEKAASYKALMGVEGIPDMSVTSVQEVAKRYEKLAGWAVRLQQQQENFNKLNVVERLPDLDLTELRERGERFLSLASFAAKQEALGKAIAQLEQDYADVVVEDRQLDAELKALGYCPTCTQPVGSDHKHAASIKELS